MKGLCDIHTHIVYGVDDGSKSIEESVKMLEKAKADGIDAMIATPHMRYGMFKYDLEKVNAHFAELKKHADDVGIDLYLGSEYHLSGEMITDLKTGRVHSLCDGKYVLLEFSFFTEVREMTDAVYSLIANGYKPVIAHAERYKEIQKDVFLCEELKNRGALIQINSSSILGEDGFNIKRCAKKILKLKLADIVASDSHGTEFRKNTLAKAYDFVVKKYGDDYAEDIFIKNPRDIIYIKDPERKTSDE